MESEDTDPFVIRPSWAMVRISRSQGHPSTLTDSQTAEKWPGPLSRRLQALMIEHRLFAVYRYEPTSIKVLQKVVDALYTCFDPPLDPIHIQRFVEKTKKKINRIRAELVSQGVLIKTDTGFILASDQPKPTDAGPHQYSQRIQMIEELLKEWYPCIPSTALGVICTSTVTMASAYNFPPADQATVVSHNWHRTQTSRA